MPHITLFPIGELLNHDNVQTYYIYQKNTDMPDSSDRYSGIIDNKDHDEDLKDSTPIINMKSEFILKILLENNDLQESFEKWSNLLNKARDFDDKEEIES